MDRNSVDWYGNFCAVVTPFNKNGAVDESAFQENIRLLVSEGLNGIVVAGDTGEFWALSDAERFRIFELARNTTDKPVIGNASAIVTSQSAAYAKGAKDRGLDGIMLTPPYYARPSVREIEHHFRAVSNAAEIPILLYNMPSRQALTLTPEDIVILSNVENAVAIKQSAADFNSVTDTIRLVGSKIRIMAGHSVDRGLACVIMGADGYISSVESQVMGREAIELYELAAGNQIEKARKVQMRCIELDKAIHGNVGTFPASLKMAMNLCGRPGGYPREPLLPPTEEQTDSLKKTLQSLGLTAS